MVVASSPELIEDIKKAPDDVLSLKGQVIEVRLLLWGWLTSIRDNRVSSSRPNTQWTCWMFMMTIT
jgi:hypothetical protein